MCIRDRHKPAQYLTFEWSTAATQRLCSAQLHVIFHASPISPIGRTRGPGTLYGRIDHPPQTALFAVPFSTSFNPHDHTRRVKTICPMFRSVPFRSAHRSPIARMSKSRAVADARARTCEVPNTRRALRRPRAWRAARRAFSAELTHIPFPRAALQRCDHKRGTSEVHLSASAARMFLQSILEARRIRSLSRTALARARWRDTCI